MRAGTRIPAFSDGAISQTQSPAGLAFALSSGDVLMALQMSMTNRARQPSEV